MIKGEDMNVKTTKSATEVRKDFFDILDQVERSGLPYTITKAGKPVVVMMSAEEFESWEETLDIMSDPEAVKGIEEGLDDLKHGRTYSYEEVFGMTQKKSLALAEKKTKYNQKKKNV